MGFEEPPEPAEIAALRAALSRYDDTCTLATIAPVIAAARGVLLEWDRGVAYRAAMARDWLTRDMARQQGLIP